MEESGLVKMVEVRLTVREAENLNVLTGEDEAVSI
jgi:hypothetical protein